MSDVPCCCIDGCDRPARSTGRRKPSMCHMHQKRVMRTGSAGEAAHREVHRPASDEECDIIKQAAGKMRADHMAAALGRSPHSLAGIARRIGVSSLRYERRGKPKLDVASVLAIRNDAAAGAAYEDLAIRFGVTVSNIYLVCSGRTWKDVGGPTTPHRRRRRGHTGDTRERDEGGRGGSRSD